MKPPIDFGATRPRSRTLQEAIDAWAQRNTGEAVRLTPSGGVERRAVAVIASDLVEVLREHGVRVVSLRYADNWAAIVTRSLDGEDSTAFLAFDGPRVECMGHIAA
jgi:hypothetical protein